MFPAISDVFSPIPRMFKRIDVENFRNIEETKDCVLNPLSEEERKKVDETSIAEIHAFSNGNPYEVQLVSHYMYKKYAESGLPRISLDVGVLEDVLNELDRLRKGGHHEIANLIKRSNRHQIRAILSSLEFPNVEEDNLARFIVLGELDALSLERVLSQVSFYRTILTGLKGRAII